jgi:hypothetical protein
MFCDQSDHIWQYWQMCECYTCSGPVFRCEFNGDVCLVIGMTIYGNTNKCMSVIYVLELFFDVNSIVMFVLWSEWPFMAILAKVWVLHMFWTSFLMWIQWWYLFGDRGDHLWQYQQMCECYIHSWIIFWCEFNGDVLFCDRSDHLW